MAKDLRERPLFINRRVSGGCLLLIKARAVKAAAAGPVRRLVFGDVPCLKDYDSMLFVGHEGHWRLVSLQVRLERQPSSCKFSS